MTDNNTTVTLTDKSIQIINTKHLTEDHIVLLSVDAGNATPESVKLYQDKLLETFSELFAPAKVVAKDVRVKVEIVKKPKTTK